MAIRRSLRSLIRVVSALIAIGTLPTTTADAVPTSLPVQLLSSAMVGPPSVTPRAVFWRESRGNQYAIFGYDLAAGAQFTIAERAGSVLGLAADDTRLAWTERDTKTGALTFLQKERGTPTRECLAFARSVAVSADGQSVYVAGASSNAIVAYRAGTPEPRPTE